MGTYNLILTDDLFPTFESKQNCVLEMICQRLSQEFQLVEGINMTPYWSYLTTHLEINSAGTSNSNSNNTNRVATTNQAIINNTTTNTNTTTNNSTSMSTTTTPIISNMSSSVAVGEELYILSMGHRIHFLLCK